MFRRAILPTTRTFLSAFESSAPSSAVRHYYPRTYSPLCTTINGRKLYSTESGKEDGNATTEVRSEKNEGSSTENGNGGEQKTTSAGAGDPAKDLLEEMTKCKADLETKVKEVADLKDKFLRSVADFRNLQDRTEREIRSAKDFAISKFARDLVETVDNMDLALNAVPEESRTSNAPEKKDLVDLYNGLKMTEGILLNTLKKHGLEKISPMGEKFDPNLHEATFQAKVEGKEPGTVFHVMRTGFSLNGRVVRAAQVGVVQAS